MQVLADIKKESTAELEASKMEWSEVESVVRTKSSQWYRHKTKQRKKKAEKKLQEEQQSKQLDGEDNDSSETKDSNNIFDLLGDTDA